MFEDDRNCLRDSGVVLFKVCFSLRDGAWASENHANSSVRVVLTTTCVTGILLFFCCYCCCALSLALGADERVLAVPQATAVTTQ